MEIQGDAGARCRKTYSFVSIRSQITDKIVQVHFREGQEVKAGDMLFTLDGLLIPRRGFSNWAQANLQRDEAQLVNARLSFERTSNLFAIKIASQADYDATVATFQSAQSTVGADAAAITNAQVNLSYTAIRSPIDGRTGNLTVKEGNVVKAPDDVIVTLTQTRPIYVAFALPEQYLPAIRQRASEHTLAVTAFAPGDTERCCSAWRSDLPSTTRSTPTPAPSCSKELFATNTNERVTVARPIRPGDADLEQPCRSHRGAFSSRASRAERRIRFHS